MTVDSAAQPFSLPGETDIPESAMPQYAAAFARLLSWPAVVFLQGDLGAGKTTFARCLLQSFGVPGSIKSPTYTLVETYTIEQGLVCHFDLYRLQEPSELEYLGARDLLSQACLALIEWPQRAEGELPPAHWNLEFIHADSSRRIIASKPRQG